MTKEQKLKLSEAHMGYKNSNYGHPRSDDTKRKISIANTGKKLSVEAKKKISSANKGKVISGWQKSRIAEGNKRKIFSEAFRRNVSKVHKGKILSVKTRNKIREKRFLQKTCFITSIELKIRKFLEDLGIGYIPHKYISNISLPCQCDIYVPQYNLIIECDGVYWHNYPHGTEKDKIRTDEMINKGYRVLRLWENDIKNMNIESFKEKIGGIKNEDHPIYE